MSGFRFLVLCLVSALAAFFGGFVSIRFASPVSVAAQSHPETVQVLRTHRLELVDKAGKQRGVLAVTEKAGAGLVLFTSTGEEMVSIGADGLGNLNPAIAFFDGKHGNARLLLGVEKDGSPTIKLADAEGRIRLGLALAGRELAGARSQRDDRQ